MFSGNPVCELGITFLRQGRKFSYDFQYDTSEEIFVFEKFAEILKDQYGNEKEIVWLLINDNGNEYKCIDEDAEQMISMVVKKSMFCHVIDTGKFKYLEDMKKIVMELAKRIDVINMNNIPIRKTIELMKNKNDQQQRIVDFIRNADLYMDNFEYVDVDQIHFSEDGERQRPEERALDVPEQLMDQIRLVSTYKGVHVPSIFFDSTGTKKIAALASYIIEALDQGRILVVDELDSSTHFKLTRAIVAMPMLCDKRKICIICEGEKVFRLIRQCGRKREYSGQISGPLSK
ncbi:MAG: ATP-binding protein [Lachnospiraceae bacterium]|nr:ATP-binding protein [Lachnospiraceae bacterium]